MTTVTSYEMFRHRVDYNTEVLKEALRTKTSLIKILPELYTWTNEPNTLHSSVIMRNAHDMLPAAYLGLLVNINANGIDGFEMLPTGECIHNELKTSEIDGSRVWQGPRGGLNIGGHMKKSEKVCVTSALNGSYHIIKNGASKNMNTILCVCDTSGPDGYFDAWEIDGDTVMHYFRSRTGKIDIKLGSFMKMGRRSKTVVPMVGYDAWAEKMRKAAPVRRIGVP